MDEHTMPGDEPTKVVRLQRAMDRMRAAKVYGLVLTEREVVEFLVRSAEEYDAEQCEEDPCEVCDGFVHIWHNVYSALTASYRLVVEEMLSNMDCPAPRSRHGGL